MNFTSPLLSEVSVTTIYHQLIFETLRRYSSQFMQVIWAICQTKLRWTTCKRQLNLKSFLKVVFATSKQWILSWIIAQHFTVSEACWKFHVVITAFCSTLKLVVLVNFPFPPAAIETFSIINLERLIKFAFLLKK